MNKIGRPKINPDTCIHADCNSAATTKSRCDKHYRQWRRDSGEIPRIYQRNVGQVCVAPGCIHPAERRGYCGTHYARVRRNGDLEPRRAANGAGHRKANGRWMTTRNGVTQYHARHVMEEHLGRKLCSDESVHHKNGDPTDDRLENLEVRPSYHGRGQTVEDAVAWAQEILERYDA